MVNTVVMAIYTTLVDAADIDAVVTLATLMLAALAFRLLQWWCQLWQP